MKSAVIDRELGAYGRRSHLMATFCKKENKHADNLYTQEKKLSNPVVKSETHILLIDQQ